MDDTRTARSIQDLLPLKVELKKPLKKITERGELLNYFSLKITKPIGFVAMKLKGIETKDLYYMQSYMKDLERTGKNAAKWWWWAIKPHES